MKKRDLSTYFPLFLVLYEMATYMSNDMYLPALPQLMKDLNVADHFAKLTITSFLLGSAVFQIFLGPISDKYGRRPVLLSGAVIFVIATITCANANSHVTLLIARFFQGATISTIVVAGYASIHEMYEHKKAIQLLALMSSISVLAPAFGPLLGSLVLEFGSWRFIFESIAVFVIPVIIGLYFVMPESNPYNEEPIRIRKLATHYHSIITNKIFMVNMITFCFIFASFIAWITAGSFITVNDYHYEEFWFGIFQAEIFISYIIGTKIVKHILKKANVEILIKIGLGIISIGALLGLMAALYAHQTIYTLIVALVIYALGAGLVFAPLQRLAIEASTAPMGLRMAVASTMICLSGVLGSALIAAFHEKGSLVMALLLFFGSSIAISFHIYMLKKCPSHD